MKKPMLPAKRGRAPATADDQHRFDAFAEYIRDNHPELSGHSERRGRYWESIKGDGSRVELNRANRLLVEWDQENPPPVSYDRQAEIRAEFLKNYSPSG